MPYESRSIWQRRLRGPEAATASRNLGGIIINRLSYSGYYDITLRHFGPMLAALTLARLASKHAPPGLSFLHRD